MIDSLMRLETIETLMQRQSQNINHQGVDISRVHEAYVNYFFEGGDLQASAQEAMTIRIQEVIASGMLTEAEVRSLDGVLAELVGDVDRVQGVGDNGIGGAGTREVVTKIKYKPSSGAVLKATPGKTTTILGNYEKDMKKIINEMGNVKSTYFGANEGGFNVLNVPDELFDPNTFWDLYNKPWLDEAINRGDDIVLATKPDGNVLTRFDYSTGEEVLTGFGQEIDYLTKKGYVYDAITNTMRLR